MFFCVCMYIVLFMDSKFVCVGLYVVVYICMCVCVTSTSLSRSQVTVRVYSIDSPSTTCCRSLEVSLSSFSLSLYEASFSELKRYRHNG